MTTYEAPAKLNLSLLVSPPRSDGYHPLESLVQTVAWCDLLDVEPGEEGTDTYESGFEDDLVERALAELRKRHTVPPLALKLVKDIPVGAGLGGGSSDAAAALLAGASVAGLDRSVLPEVALSIGADVPLFLTGGTLHMSGIGEVIEAARSLEDFAVAIVVPDFQLSTKDVYRRWDTMEGPVGDAIPEERLPPSLRGGMPTRNDLLPAALDVEHRLGDFISDVSSAWGTPVAMTGSGSACFGYFATLDEASDAASAVSALVSEARGVELRSIGVRKIEDRLGREAR